MSEGAEVVAKLIMNRLLEEQLIEAKDAAKMLPKLAGGKLRAEDWRLAVEKLIAEVSSDERTS